MNASAKAKPDYGTYPRLAMPQAREAAEHLLAMKGEGAEVDLERLHRIERFYYREARMLDEERYQEWYELLADDLFYWMPLIESRYRNDKRPHISPGHMAFFDESKADIAVRIGRLESNLVWTEDPPTRHVYIVSSIEAFETGTPGEYECHSTFIQYRNRVEHDEATLHGRRRDLLREEDGGFQIVRRLILLPQSILQTKNLSVFF